ncbi:Domain of unknown function DUF1885 [Caldalkalibacillus thermarum TA2.A1]|uniref:DUF1885 family protein n=1 Tax=Caldalkalibacillus thermarum (strain TA2.A1) TaxID=986075 RepID=F5L848_CALTT|nr:DUF1885 family protein [Caldalkalibacillus thermarum]EGL82461.1 Domain of unknown function DUF1885 [Caldalkalibacillus thermarum TA2.A1]GGK14942.1 hypothetical protein GCM10010965_04930 [Caldalkalibacillus thermarum]
MSQSAYIRLVEESTMTESNLDDVKQKLERYISMTTKTGQQLAWHYEEAAFPYTIEEKSEGKGKWLYLKGNNPELYKYIVIGVGSETVMDEESGQEKEEHYIQVVLPDGATHGDKSKANEFCKYLAKAYQAKLQLFNGRTMYFYPRKP